MSYRTDGTTSLSTDILDLEPLKGNVGVLPVGEIAVRSIPWNEAEEAVVEYRIHQTLLQKLRAMLAPKQIQGIVCESGTISDTFLKNALEEHHLDSIVFPLFFTLEKHTYTTSETQFNMESGRAEETDRSVVVFTHALTLQFWNTHSQTLIWEGWGRSTQGIHENNRTWPRRHR